MARAQDALWPNLRKQTLLGKAWCGSWDTAVVDILVVVASSTCYFDRRLASTSNSVVCYLASSNIIVVLIQQVTLTWCHLHANENLFSNMSQPLIIQRIHNCCFHCWLTSFPIFCLITLIVFPSLTSQAFVKHLMIDCVTIFNHWLMITSVFTKAWFPSWLCV